MSSPLFTIITATYNASENISDLAESLLSQSYQNFQWLVQDGASTDNTEAIIKSYSDRLNISFMSKKDTGIYDAWNKAIKRIEGEWVLFFGADDVFQNKTTLLKLAQFIKTAEEEKSINSKTMYIASSILIGDMPFVPFQNYQERMQKQMPFPYPGLVHRANIFEKYSYNSQYEIAGDYDFLVRTLLAEKDAEVVFNKRTLCKMGNNGISNNREYTAKRHRETYEVIKDNFGEEIAYPALRNVFCSTILHYQKEENA